MRNILVVEDDAKLNRSVCIYLNNSGYEATGCLGAQEAYDALYAKPYGLILSDIMMPGTDGFAFAEAVRRVDRSIPILFMTARDDISAKQRGFRIGIDDYMVKPIDLEELVLRVGALLRRANILEERRLELGDLVLDADAMTAAVRGEEVPVTVREFQILFKLLSCPNRTFSRSQLMNEFWGLEADSSLRAVDVYIAKLRDKFSGCAGFRIQTVHGLGYKAVPA